MKTLLLAAAVALISSAARACPLTQSDYQSLGSSPSQITPQTFSALTPAQQQSVCATRNFLQRVDAQSGVITKIEAYSAKYLTPAENQRIINATDALLNSLFASKGIGVLA